MQVLPRPTNISLDYKELYQFLLACQQKSLLKNTRQFISIPVAIEQVDPLIIFENLAKQEQLNFYFENRGKQEAIAAIDAVAQLQIEGKNRFNKVQDFIKTCLENIIIFDKLNKFTAEPRFFCSFSFFDTTEADYPFAAATVFLPRWQIVRNSDRTILVANIAIEPNTNLPALIPQLKSDISNIVTIEHQTNKYSFSPNLHTKDIADTRKLQQTIVAALESIKAKKLNKIVLAQALNIWSAKNFSLYNSLDNLRQNHPNCYIFSISNSRGQNFIGASPERLISISDRKLEIDALAGSAPRGKTAIADKQLATQLLNSDKEKREHKVVIDFITQHLNQLGIKPQILAPRLRQLSNIQHLWTPIEAKIPHNVHPLEIVAQLHPTPAVAGETREIACQQIRRYENFERGLYAAPLGWIDTQNNSEFIVGIRSALLDRNRATLYAGAGIVAGSDPAKELAEIQLKLQALLKALT